MKDYLERKLRHAQKRLEYYEDNKEILSNHGWWSKGYFEGKISAIEGMLDELEEESTHERM